MGIRGIQTVILILALLQGLHSTDPAKCAILPIGLIPAEESYQATYISSDKLYKDVTEFDFTLTGWTPYNSRTAEPFLQKFADYSDHEFQHLRKKLDCRSYDKTSSQQLPESDFNTAFGKYPAYNCTIPHDKVVILLRFDLSFDEPDKYPKTPIGSWNVFLELKKEANYQHSLFKIHQQVSQLIRQSGLNSLEGRQNLNIIPQFTKQSVAGLYIYSPDSHTASIENGEVIPITDYAFLKVLFPQTHILIGRIDAGNPNLLQVYEKLRQNMKQANICQMQVHHHH